MKLLEQEETSKEQEKVSEHGEAPPLLLLHVSGASLPAVPGFTKKKNVIPPLRERDFYV